MTMRNVRLFALTVELRSVASGPRNRAEEAAANWKKLAVAKDQLLHEEKAARVRAEAERELALEAMREWKRRALILARQVKDMGDAA